MKCTYLQCGATGRRFPERKFYSYPKPHNPVLKEWIKVSNIKDADKRTKRIRRLICEAHFTRDSFTPKGHLKKGSFPTIPPEELNFDNIEDSSEDEEVNVEDSSCESFSSDSSEEDHFRLACSTVVSEVPFLHTTVKEIRRRKTPPPLVFINTNSKLASMQPATPATPLPKIVTIYPPFMNVKRPEVKISLLNIRKINPNVSTNYHIEQNFQPVQVIPNIKTEKETVKESTYLGACEEVAEELPVPLQEIKEEEDHEIDVQEFENIDIENEIPTFSMYFTEIQSKYEEDLT